MLERVLREGTLDASEKKLIVRLADTSRTARAEAERALLKRQADEIEAVSSSSRPQDVYDMARRHVQERLDLEATLGAAHCAFFTRSSCRLLNV